MSEQHQPRRVNTSGAHKAPPAQQGRTVYHGGAQRSGAGRTLHTSNAAGNAAGHAAGHTAGSAGRASSASSARGRVRGYDAPPPPRKKRKKRRIWLPLVASLLVIVLALGGLYVWVVRSISPEGGTPTISELIKTPSEYKGDVINILVCGIDYEEGRAYGGDEQSNDGMTDMIMYVSFDVANKKISMMQIPRNVVVGDLAPNTNGQINSVALAGGGVAALAQAVNDQLKLPVDHWITIDMQSLKEIVDVFGGVWVNVPHDISYGGSTILEGYRKLDGAAAEFFVRNRKGDGYANSDLDRLMMQRYFYQGLLREFREMTVWDAAKMVPVACSYVKTSLDTGTIVSLAISLLRVDSANIMLCRMPVYQAAEYYRDNSVLVADRDGTAALLNEYFRSYGSPVEPEALNLFDWPVSGSPFDASIQFMGQLDTEGQDAQAAAGIDTLD